MVKKILVIFLIIIFIFIIPSCKASLEVEKETISDTAIIETTTSETKSAEEIKAEEERIERENIHNFYSDLYSNEFIDEIYDNAKVLFEDINSASIPWDKEIIEKYIPSIIRSDGIYDEKDKNLILFLNSKDNLYRNIFLYYRPFDDLDKIDEYGADTDILYSDINSASIKWETKTLEDHLSLVFNLDRKYDEKDKEWIQFLKEKDNILRTILFNYGYYIKLGTINSEYVQPGINIYLKENFFQLIDSAKIPWDRELAASCLMGFFFLPEQENQIKNIINNLNTKDSVYREIFLTLYIPGFSDNIDELYSKTEEVYKDINSAKIPWDRETLRLYFFKIFTEDLANQTDEFKIEYGENEKKIIQYLNDKDDLFRNIFLFYESKNKAKLIEVHNRGFDFSLDQESTQELNEEIDLEKIDLEIRKIYDELTKDVSSAKIKWDKQTLFNYLAAILEEENPQYTDKTKKLTQYLSDKDNLYRKLILYFKPLEKIDKLDDIDCDGIVFDKDKYPLSYSNGEVYFLVTDSPETTESIVIFTFKNNLTRYLNYKPENIYTFKPCSIEQFESTINEVLSKTTKDDGFVIVENEHGENKYLLFYDENWNEQAYDPSRMNALFKDKEYSYVEIILTSCFADKTQNALNIEKSLSFAERKSVSYAMSTNVLNEMIWKKNLYLDAFILALNEWYEEVPSHADAILKSTESLNFPQNQKDWMVLTPYYKK